ncbi:MAG: selenide, water dikinase SelD [Acidimicrobiales bacterium]
MAVVDIKLTEWTTCGGCAAKWGGAPLAALVRSLATRPLMAPEAPGRSGPGDDGPRASLLVGLAPFDDAAVFRLADDLAVVSTTDFFPPLVDDPADFGAVAAANATSDVFAMGGRVLLALNIAAFPERMPPEAIAAIFRGAAEIVAEAGGVVAGGHTIRSEEPIFGLAVQGVVHPDRILTKGGARPGDVLVLSKPIGTGIVLAGGSDDAKRAVIDGMCSLNRAAAETLVALGPAVHAVTDVTGFGLLGHGWEVAERSGVRLAIDGSAVPLYDGSLATADAGVRTGGDARNRRYLDGHVTSAASNALEALAYDPQTSGGLLAAVDRAAAADLAAAGFVAVGEVATPDPEPGVDLR